MRALLAVTLGLVLTTGLATLAPPAAADTCSLTDLSQQPECAIAFLLQETCVYDPTYPVLHRTERICWAP